MILRGRGDTIEGEKLVAVGRKISKPIIIPETARYGGQQIHIYGAPAKCYVDIRIRILSK